MEKKSIDQLDTPALLINLDQMEKNLKDMQDFADSVNVKLRPHTKTHKMADVSHLQIEYGAKGITVAKVSEAEAMANTGIDDIFIATEIVGQQKLERVANIAKKAKIRLGVDSIYHVEQYTKYLGNQPNIEIMIEVDTGQGRCGVKPDQALALAETIIESYPQLKLAGIFTHEGHTYDANDKEHMKEIVSSAQAEAVKIGEAINKKFNVACEVSVGCTLAQLLGVVVPGVTEVRPGTYTFYDVGHGYFLEDYSYCAATILSTVMSKTEHEKVVADAGAKSITIDQRSSGILKTNGFGVIKGHPNYLVKSLSDEHAVITTGDSLNIGDRIEIIPNHVCPTVNLYEKAYGIRNGKIEKVLPITARGCIQ